MISEAEYPRVAQVVTGEEQLGRVPSIPTEYLAKVAGRASTARAGADPARTPAPGPPPVRASGSSDRLLDDEAPGFGDHDRAGAGETPRPGRSRRAGFVVSGDLRLGNS